jgi:hypothetical protein
MKSLMKRAAVALAAAVAGISNATAGVSNTELSPSLQPDQSAKGVAGVLPQGSGGTGLSLEDLRVGPTGKVPADIGSVGVPVRVAEDSKCKN